MAPSPRDEEYAARMYDRYVAIFRAINGLTITESLSVLMVAFVAIAKGTGLGLISCLTACVDIWADDDSAVDIEDDGPPTERIPTDLN